MRHTLRYMLSLMVACCALLLASGCTMVQKKPSFQPLTLDLSGDMAPRDPSLPPGGDVYCVIGDGTAMIDGQWRAYDSTGFVLPGNGMMSSVRIDAARGSTFANMRAYYDEPGQKMIFCPTVSRSADGVIDCASIYAMNEDLRDGIKRTFEVPNGVMSGHISCGYDQNALRPL